MAVAFFIEYGKLTRTINRLNPTPAPSLYCRAPSKRGKISRSASRSLLCPLRANKFAPTLCVGIRRGEGRNLFSPVRIEGNCIIYIRGPQTGENFKLKSLHRILKEILRCAVRRGIFHRDGKEKYPFFSFFSPSITYDDCSLTMESG